MRDAIAFSRSGVIFQFALSLADVLMLLVIYRYQPEKQINDYAEELDISKEREKLAISNKTLRLGPDTYSLAFRAQHISSSK